MTVQELSRAVARIDTGVHDLSVQVGAIRDDIGALRGALGQTQAVLDLREQHQGERTRARDRQIDALHARMDEQDRTLADLQRRWWTMTGRLAGVAAAMTLLGSGAATMVTRLAG